MEQNRKVRSLIGTDRWYYWFEWKGENGIWRWVYCNAKI